MSLHRDTGSDEPCRHMEGHLNRVADGTARGLRLWYTLQHVARCPQCRRFLDSLKGMIGRLRESKLQEPNDESIGRILAAYRSAKAASQTDSG